MAADLRANMRKSLIQHAHLAIEEEDYALLRWIAGALERDMPQ